MPRQPRRPRYHRVISERVMKDHGNAVTEFTLQYNQELGEKALCKGMDTEVFFPTKELYTQEELALYESMCSECPVMLMCFEWALAHEVHGVWGGTSPLHRRMVRKSVGWVVSEPKM